MNFYDYINSTPRQIAEYADQGLLEKSSDRAFPLDIYTYGRTTVHESAWDNVTRKCRGIIVNRETGEIVARPFEKFFNFGSTEVPGCTRLDITNFETQPVIWEKLDGFLCTLYHWEGKPWIASKGSFHSVHAKWATAWYRQHVKDVWPKGYTPIFEGLCPGLRIVVDYGDREELVLLALINNETGAELPPDELLRWADKNGISIPRQFDFTWQNASNRVLYQNNGEEGYVLTWYQSYLPPFRLKMKYQDYLRLHRMVTGVSPKHILEVLQNGWTTELDEMLHKSTPWFAAFVTKWKRAFELEYARLADHAQSVYDEACQVVYCNDLRNAQEIRKDFAFHFTRPSVQELSPLCFALLDGKDIAPIIWKKLKVMTKNQRPMVGEDF